MCGEGASCDISLGEQDGAARPTNHGALCQTVVCEVMENGDTWAEGRGMCIKKAHHWKRGGTFV